jgi:hypothetical protein
MIQIDYPVPSFRRKSESGKEMIFDPLRKRWLVLTPEEWVRQNFVQYLVQQKKYPASLIAMEKEIWLGELKKRFDILVYNSVHKPFMMVECKGPGIDLNENVLQQVLRYNIPVPVRYMIITNGDRSFGWEKKQSGLELINEIPPFNQAS